MRSLQSIASVTFMTRFDLRKELLGIWTCGPVPFRCAGDPT